MRSANESDDRSLLDKFLDEFVEILKCSGWATIAMAIMTTIIAVPLLILGFFADPPPPPAERVKIVEQPQQECVCVCEQGDK